MAAFVSSFSGTGVGPDARGAAAVSTRRAASSNATVRMAAPIPSGMSSVFRKLMYVQSEKMVRQPGPGTATEKSLGLGTDDVTPMAGYVPRAPEFDPRPPGTGVGGYAAMPIPAGFRINKAQAAVDEYMAKSLKQQFKAAAIPAGVYLPQCTEGNVKGAAEQARIAALAKDFRQKQRSASMVAYDLFEGRRMAIKAVAHDCEYEEATFRRYPMAGATFVMGMSEKMRACDRYMQAGAEDAAGAYVQGTVQRSMKQRACPGGVYSTSCADGTVKGAAEDARVAALAAAYRARQMGDLAKTGATFAARKQARDWFTNGCDYEEGLVNLFPAAAAAMRASTNRY
eukprot:CAMPEP_0185845180 /NCGR_PEP_ID=MMETSP1354-20130828/1209_1 /TAXON_ID=708628 /ORGANISM="Erythrolobus madagascarensis, Strain CCMP3276" /LENGTH=340 /DNA_ID=CAMNT_0028545075 /DNA_START=182 /DNA_END=1204 /DNA_ORIENTATION=+